MKKFVDYPAKYVMLVTAIIGAIMILLALNFGKLPIINNYTSYQARFANNASLQAGNLVSISGVQVGTVTGLKLDGNSVLISFKVHSNTKFGDQTKVESKVLTPLGASYINLIPKGNVHQSGSQIIPENRTVIPYTLQGDLNTAGSTLQQINIDQLEGALNTITDLLRGTDPNAVSTAFDSIAKLSQLFGNQQSNLSKLVTGTNALSQTIDQNKGNIVNLVNYSNVILGELTGRQQEINTLLSTTSTLSSQLNDLFGGNQQQLTTMVNNLQQLSATLVSDSGDISKAIPMIAAFAKYGANAAGSGPYLDANAPTLLMPDNVIKQCSHAPPNPQLGCGA